jgi:hypothetical protein
MSLDLKLAGEPYHLETWMSGSGEGSWKSAVRELAGCLSHCPRAFISAYVPAVMVLVWHRHPPSGQGANMAGEGSR